MTTAPSAAHLRPIALAGVALAAAVVAMAWMADRPPEPPPATKNANKIGEKSVAGQQAVLPFAATTTAAAGADGAQIPAIKSEDLGDVVRSTIDEVAAAPDQLRGHLFECRNTLDALPFAWRVGRKDSGTDRTDALLGPQTHAAPYRLTLSCQAADLRLFGVVTYFDDAVVDALPAIGRDTVVTLQFLGLAAAGQLVARYVRVDALPQQLGRADDNRPDWLDALLHPAAAIGHVQRCSVATTPRLLDAAALDSATAAAALPLSHTEPTVQTWAALTCADRRNVAVPVLLQLDLRRQAELLQLAPGVVVQTTVVAVAANRVVVRYEGLLQGGERAESADLRHVLLAAQAARGTTIHCVSMGLPSAQTLASDDENASLLDLAALAPRQAWVVCAQAPRPPVHVALYFRPGEQNQLLAIGRGTQLALTVLGVRSDTILAVLAKVEAHPTDIAGRDDDLRRFALLTEKLVGQKLHCQLGQELQAPAPGQVPRRAEKLFAYPVSPFAKLARCTDTLHPFDGEPFVLFWPAGHSAKDALPHPGAVLQLQLAGMVNNVPVAGVVGRLDR